MSNIQEYNDLIAFHPGSYIEDIIDNLNITQKEYAEKLGVTEKTLSNLVNGKIRLSNEVANKLSLSTGVSITSWFNLQNKYDEMIIEIENQRKLDKEKEIVKLIDYKYFQTNNLLPIGRTAILEKISNIHKLFNISNLDYLKKFNSQVSYRNPSKKFDEKTIINSNIMLEIALIKANQISAPKYNKAKLEEILPLLPSWTLLDPKEYYNKLLIELRKCGIILVVLPHLKNAGINGAVKKLKSGSVLLMLNDRGKDADIFWFSLCHELGHILEDDYEINLIGNSLATEKEDVADKIARNILINEDNYNSFLREGKFTRENVIRFANDNNVHVGIVVGRLQNEKHIDYKDLYDLKQRITIVMSDDM